MNLPVVEAQKHIQASSIKTRLEPTSKRGDAEFLSLISQGSFPSRLFFILFL